MPSAAIGSPSGWPTRRTGASSSDSRRSKGAIASPPMPGEVIAITGTDWSIIANGPCNRSAPENAWALR